MFHSAEIQFVFGTDPAFPLALAGASGQPTAAAMQAIWTRFAATGDPAGAGPAWPAFDPAGDRHLVLDTAPAAASGHKRETCDFWDALAIP